MGEIRSGGIPRQYSLRTLLFATTGAGVILGIAPLDVIVLMVLLAAVAVMARASPCVQLAENCIIVATLMNLLIGSAVLCFGAIRGMVALWNW